jgi:ElaB/YqjD/DUF883 family membrane-anchored ribosome-binding protein
LTGWERPELLVRGPKSSDIHHLPELGVVELQAERHCLVQAPLQTTLEVDGSVDGNATINLLLGPVKVHSVDGHLQINSCGPLKVHSVDGHLNVRAVAGSCQIDSVDGNARVAQVAGDLLLHKVDGNLVISEVVGNVQAETDGNADLSLALVHGQHVQVSADGNIVCRIQPDASVKVRLEAEGAIRVKNLGETRRSEDDCLEFQLGDGGALLDLRADGDITLLGADLREFGARLGFEAEVGEEMGRRAAELGQQIAQQVEAQVTVLTREMEEKLARMGENDQMANKLQERLTSTMRRAEEKLAEAMRKIEVRAADRTPEVDRRRKGYSWQAPPPAPPAPPVPPRRNPVSDEERMMILRMVEQGKISVEQAEKLLAALNG